MGSTRGLISAVDQTASVRHQPFERSRPEQQKPEAKKNRDCNRAERVLIDSEYLSYCSEGNHYDRKGTHKAKRNEHRPCVATLGDRRAEKYRQNGQRARSGDRQHAGEQSNESGQHWATPNMARHLRTDAYFARERSFVTKGTSRFCERSDTVSGFAAGHAMNNSGSPGRASPVTRSRAVDALLFHLVFLHRVLAHSVLAHGVLAHGVLAHGVLAHGVLAHSGVGLSAVRHGVRCSRILGEG